MKPPRIKFGSSGGKGWGWAFFASHLFGWAVAWAQTLWLVYEVKKTRCELQEEIRGIKRNIRRK